MAFSTSFRSKNTYVITVYKEDDPDTYCIVKVTKKRDTEVKVDVCVSGGEVTRSLEREFQAIIDKYPFPPWASAESIENILTELFASIVSES